MVCECVWHPIRVLLLTAITKCIVGVLSTTFKIRLKIGQLSKSSKIN